MRLPQGPQEQVAELVTGIADAINRGRVPMPIALAALIELTAMVARDGDVPIGVIARALHGADANQRLVANTLRIVRPAPLWRPGMA